MTRNIFKDGKSQSITDVLQEKDMRVQIQQAVLHQHPDQVLVDIKMNIPGPIKNNRYLTRIFDKGIKDFEQTIEQVDLTAKLVKELDVDAGQEKFYIIGSDLFKIKKAAIAFEENSTFGRLFDADVITKNSPAAISRKDLGLPVRKCFLCNRPAKECARSRRHSVEEMQAYISKLYCEQFEKQSLL